MSELKTRIQSDMTAAMKARDELSLNTLRMTMTAIRNAEVSGKADRELTDQEVQDVVKKQAKQRAEAAEAFAGAGRKEQAQRERDEHEILARYLPEQLTDEELIQIIDGVFASGDFTDPKHMGVAMKAVKAEVGDRADGKTVATLVKQRLQG
ncbi:MAG TPA: GatB/YqeY domain-containing protein [Candidatus Stackebrandtia faecavium]|nr:GatB/YqeY domain-containing protein [Candidatus Stackebrandtia faecavium]